MPEQQATHRSTRRSANGSIRATRADQRDFALRADVVIGADVENCPHDVTTGRQSGRGWKQAAELTVHEWLGQHRSPRQVDGGRWRRRAADEELQPSFDSEWGVALVSDLDRDPCLLYTSDAADERSSVD